MVEEEPKSYNKVQQQILDSDVMAHNNYRGMSDRLAAKRVDPNRDNMYSEVKMNEDAPNTTHVLVQEIKNNGSFEDVE